MSVRVMTAVWSIDLPDSQKIVLLALADCANDEGLCWPSMATLAKKCSKGERTVQGVIKQLVADGHLGRQEIPGKGCKYTVHPRSGCAPAKAAPAQRTTKTPAAAADKPSRTIKQPKGRAHEMPANWWPAEFGEGSESRKVVAGWPPGEIERQVEAFSAHHRARGNEFRDWQQAWSTWVLNSKNFNRDRNHGRKSSSNDQIQNPYARVVARREAERAAAEFG